MAPKRKVVTKDKGSAPVAPGYQYSALVSRHNLLTVTPRTKAQKSHTTLLYVQGLELWIISVSTIAHSTLQKTPERHGIAWCTLPQFSYLAEPCPQRMLLSATV